MLLLGTVTASFNIVLWEVCVGVLVGDVWAGECSHRSLLPCEHLHYCNPANILHDMEINNWWVFGCYRFISEILSQDGGH